MTLIRVLVCSVGLVIALAPTMVAFAADTSADHLQAELANASAQYQLALQQIDEIRAAGMRSEANERMIAFLQSEATRQQQLGEAANGNAIEQVASTLANAVRSNGNLNATNELLILQGKAAVLVSKADATMANALAQNRPDEIANARAQSVFLHQLADTITSVLAEQNISNAKLIAENEADVIHGPAIAAQANGTALAAGAVFEADQILAASTVAVSSSSQTASTKAQLVLAKATDSLANARAMAAAGQ